MTADRSESELAPVLPEPVFGARDPGIAYLVRPSAYAVIEDAAGRIALVRTPEGVYLPGGGIEAGETAPQAIVREAIEECGLAVRVGSWSVAAVQFCYAIPEQEHFEKHSVFFEAAIERIVGGATEADHELFWAAAGEAPAALSHESQAWAVTRWVGRIGRE